MADLTLTVAGRSHSIAVRDGEEAKMIELADRLNAFADPALRASGGLSGERTMLFLALLIADKLVETERNPPGGIAPDLLDRIANRLEAVAAGLEDCGAEA